MQIQLNQQEICKAIRDYLFNDYNLKVGNSAVDFTNTRGSDGLIATIDTTCSIKLTPKNEEPAMKDTSVEAPKSLEATDEIVFKEPEKPQEAAPKTVTNGKSLFS